MKKVLLLVMVAGCWVASFATDARVISMGRHDDFFMDEVSIFRNPANINIYPNMVYGSYGVYRPLAGDKDTSAMSALDRSNRDPVDPFFGAIVSYSLNQNSENRNQYPMFSFGAIFNRHDEMLDYITKGTDKYAGTATDSLVPPVGKIDLLLGYVLQNGGMLGLGGYMAFQSATKAEKVLYETSLYRVNGGVNWPIAKSVNLEVSASTGILRAQGDPKFDTAETSLTSKDVIADNDLFFNADIRLFSALTMLNGDFVPHLGIQHVSLYRGDVELTNVAAGLGLNINIDKGFFWAGLEGLYKGKSYKDSTLDGIGTRISFGIERSILRDWFVIRIGGQKEILYTTKDASGVTYGRWNENNPSDASDQDLVGLGFGVNIDNRARIDFVAAEDIAYTFTNLVSAPMHHIFTRVSATYSF